MPSAAGHGAEVWQGQLVRTIREPHGNIDLIQRENVPAGLVACLRRSGRGRTSVEDRVKCTLLSRAETEKRGRLWRKLQRLLLCGARRPNLASSSLDPPRRPLFKIPARPLVDIVGSIEAWKRSGSL